MRLSATTKRRIVSAGATVFLAATVGCGNSSSAPGTASASISGQASASATAELPPGQGSFSIQSSTTAFNPSHQSTAGSIQGVVDGLPLTAAGIGTSTGPEVQCFFGTLDSSASGTLGGIQITGSITVS
jgi:hypothetical protein